MGHANVRRDREAMTKLLIDAATLGALIAKQPEIEIEITKNASAQIAELFRRKVLDRKEGIVDNLINEINGRLNYKYHLPDNVLKVIREATTDHIKKLNEQNAEALASKAF